MGGGSRRRPEAKLSRLTLLFVLNWFEELKQRVLDPVADALAQ